MPIQRAEQVLELLDPEATVVAVDEAQFFDDPICSASARSPTGAYACWSPDSISIFAASLWSHAAAHGAG